MTRRGNGEGTVYRRSDGRWGATLTRTDGKRQTVYAQSRRDVQDRLSVLIRARQDGLLIASPTQSTGAYLERWVTDTVRPSVRPLTFQSYELNVRRLRPFLGRVRLSALSPAHVQAAYGGLLRTGLSARSVEQAHAVLHRALGQAVMWGMIPRNPCDAVSVPRPERREMQSLVEEQVQRLFRATEEERLHALWVLLATAGLRLGEALGLRWSDLDLEGGRLIVRRALQRQTGVGMVFVEPKTGRSRRTVHLAQGTVRALRAHRDRQGVERRRAGELWNENELVFCTEVGRPIEPGYVNWRLHKALKAAGLPPIRVHDLRHTAASLLLTRGVHPKVVQEMLGHTKIQLTLDTYSHVLPALHAEVATHMDDLFWREEGPKLDKLPQIA